MPDFPYSILASSNSDTLNSLIKNIIKEEAAGSKPDEFISDLDAAEFDFYVNGNFLDATLHELIKSNDQIKTVSSN